MFDFLRRLKPRVMLVRRQETKLISVRGLIKFDYVRKDDGFRFLQYGEGKIKWIMILPKEQKAPLFLSGHGWLIRFNRRRFKAGTTKKPMNFTKMWGQNVSGANRGDQGLREQNKFVRLGMPGGIRDVGDSRSGRSTERDGAFRRISV